MKVDSTPNPNLPAQSEVTRQVLAQLDDGFTHWQRALLQGRLSNFQACTNEQRALSRKIAELIGRGDFSNLVIDAARIRERARVFLATLRRMQRMLAARSQALQGCARLYTPTNSQKGVV